MDKTPEQRARRTFYDAMGDSVPPCAFDGPAAWDSITPPQQIKICEKCSLQVPCQAYADTIGDKISGIWAGRSYPRTPQEQARERL